MTYYSETCGTCRYYCPEDRNAYRGTCHKLGSLKIYGSFDAAEFIPNMVCQDDDACSAYRKVE